MAPCRLAGPLPTTGTWRAFRRGAVLARRRRPPGQQAARGTWDPDGVLPPSTGGHFARRERERAAKLTSSEEQFQNEAASLLQAALSQTRPLRPITDRWRQRGGIPAGDPEAYDKQGFREQMKSTFTPVDLDFPGLRIQHLDPPVFTVDNFFTAEQCDEVIEAALGTGQLQASKIGAGNANALTASNTYHSRRTSYSMVVEHGPVFRSRYPRLAALADTLQRRGLALFGAGEGREWGVPGKLPAPGQYAYEGLQVTRYEQGQHFLAHEDAFPVIMARKNRFNRHATLLLYLNSVEDGGSTRFDQLNLSVQPLKGTALLFFPAFADGTPDARTLHTADDAVDTKWVTQQWVARGLALAPASAALPVFGGTASSAQEDAGAEVLRRAKAKKEGKGRKVPAAKGFGGPK